MGKSDFYCQEHIALTEVRFPRKFRPREDFSHMAEKSDRVGEIYRAEIEFGNFTSRVKFLLMPVISPEGFSPRTQWGTK